jgi:opacity protein-like surface antigen
MIQTNQGFSMLKKCVFVALIALFPSLGHSIDLTNWYLRGLVGYNHVSIPSIHKARMEASGGYVVGGAIGYRFSRTFRLESELSYRSNSLDKLIIRGDSADINVDLDGNVSSFAYMGNVFFDLPFNWPIVPYVGAGLGGYREWGNGSIPVLNGTPDEVRLKVREGGAAYQVIAGLNVLHCNRIDAGVEYHFLDSIANPDSDRNHSVVISCRGTF